MKSTVFIILTGVKDGIVLCLQKAFIFFLGDSKIVYLFLLIESFLSVMIIVTAFSLILWSRYLQEKNTFK